VLIIVLISPEYALGGGVPTPLWSKMLQNDQAARQSDRYISDLHNKNIPSRGDFMAFSSVECLHAGFAMHLPLY